MTTPRITPERLAQIRVEAESEFRDHVWADDVIDELLTALEQATRAGEQ